MEVFLVMLHTFNQMGVPQTMWLITLSGFMGTRIIKGLPYSSLPCVDNQ